MAAPSSQIPPFPPFRDPAPGDLFCLAEQQYYIEIAELLLVARDGARTLGWLVRALDGSVWKLTVRDDSLDGVRFSGRPIDDAARTFYARALEEVRASRPAC